MKLNESVIKEEVYKCSKCGLCQSVCPVYLALKNEMFLPRGRFVILNNYFNNSKKLSENFIKNLDVCLNCNLCMKFCPSNINSADIFNYYKQSTPSIFSTLYFLYLNLYGIISLKFLKFSKKKKINNPKGKVIYFEGCYNKYIDSSDKNYFLKIMEIMGYNVQVVSFCCGYPYINEGNYTKFNKNMEKIKKSCNSDIDYIICSCDSCCSILKQYSDFNDKLITFDEFLKLKGYELPDTENCVYHRPLLRDSECYLPKNMKEINKKGSCSLMENFFILKNYKYVNKIINSVFYKKSDIEENSIVTSCNLSLWGLKKMFRLKKYNNKVISYSEYIYKYGKIK